MHLDVSELNSNELPLTAKIETGSMDAEKMMTLVQQLPEGYRTVFNMFIVDGYSHKEISDYLEISESTSKTQLFKARKQLQEWLKDWF
jgi:RNA polymerase sigma-70 factor (ECF subfamily)